MNATIKLETVTAAVRLQMLLEVEKNRLIFAANMAARLLSSHIPIQREYVREVHDLAYSKNMKLPAFKSYQYAGNYVRPTPEEVVVELEKLSSNDVGMPDAIHLVIYLLDNPIVEVNKEFLNQYINKCVDLNTYEPLQELGLVLVNRMQVSADGQATDFGIPGFGNAEFDHIIGMCIAHKQYDVAGRIALAARQKGWKGIDDLAIRDTILEPYYLDAVGSLSNSNVYDPLKHESEALLHPYSKMWKLMAEAMEVLPIIDYKFIMRLFDLKSSAGISPSIAQSYLHLIRAPLIQHEKASVSKDEIDMWVTMMASEGLGYQAGVVGAEAVTQGFVSDSSQFEDYMNQSGSHGKIPLLCAAIRARKFVNKQYVQRFATESPDAWLAVDAVIEGMDAGMVFEPADIEQWLKRCNLHEKERNTAGARLVKAALLHGVKLSPEVLTEFCQSCVNVKLPWLAVDLALAADDAEIRLNEVLVDQWRDACFHAEFNAETAESIISLIEVYRSRPEYKQDPGMNDQVARAFETVMEQREQAGITDTMPAAELESKVQLILSGGAH